MTSKLQITKTWNDQPISNHYNVEFSISSSTGDMIVKIDAPFHNNSPPPTNGAGRFPGLNSYEVVEIFISSYPDNYSNCNPYLEIQVNPHGQYFIVYFINEGDWDTQDCSIELDQYPISRINRETGRWTSEISIPSYLLPEPKCHSDLSVNWLCNVAAIYTENTNGTVFKGPPIMNARDENRIHVSHALLPGYTPNFHQLGAFVPLVLQESMQIRMTVNRACSIAHEMVQSYMPGDAQPDKVSTGKKIGFTRSTTDNTKNAHSLLQDVAVSMAYMSNMKLEGEGSPGGKKGSSNVQNTVEQVAFTMREELLRSNKAVELDEKFSRHIQSDEFVILHGYVWKRKGVSYKSRMLILTSKPRLLYFHRTGVYKGCIPWTMTKPPTVTKRNDKKFDLETHDKTRIYHLSDSALGSERWVSALGRFIEAQSNYVKAAQLK